jgi:hypothetical protein
MSITESNLRITRSYCGGKEECLGVTSVKEILQITNQVRVNADTVAT